MQVEFRTATIGFGLLLLLAVGGCSSSSSTTTCCDTIQGSGVSVQESRTVSGFTRVTMASVGTVHIQQTGAEALTITAEDNVLPHIRTSVNNGVLEITTDPSVNLVPTLPIQYELEVASLDGLLLAGVGTINGSTLAAPSLTLVHTGVGLIDLSAIDVTDLAVGVTGVGSVRLGGTVSSQTVTLTGVGDYEAEPLASTDAVVTISGVGSATLRVSDTLQVTIPGSGWVYYYGDPVVTSNISGTGGIERKGP